MSLIHEISGDLLVKLSGGQSNSSSSSNINGMGVGASIKSDSTDFKTGLDTGLSAFTNSALRFASAIKVFQVTENALSDIQSIVETLYSLAKTSADEQTSADERGTLNSQFQKALTEYSQVLNNAQISTTDLMDSGDLADVLKEAGVDTSQATMLVQAFSKVGGKDGEVGYEKIVLSDESTANPLLQAIDTQSNAKKAEETFKALKDEIKTDFEGISNVVSELTAGRNFAAIAVSAFSSVSERIISFSEAESAAEEIVSLIQSSADDPSLSEHSDLDTHLAKDLLS